MDFSAQVIGTEFFWDFDDGNTSTEPDPEHTYAAPGTYEPRFTYTTPDGSRAVCNRGPVIQVCPGTRPTASFTETLHLPAQAPLWDVEFTSTSSNANRLLWYFQGTAGIGSPIVHNFGGPGTYHIILIAEDACGRSDRAEKRITLDAAGNLSAEIILS